MINYNLLPQQKTLQEKKYKIFVAIWSFTFIGGIIMLIFWCTILQYQNTTQLITLQKLQQNLNTLNIQKQKLEIKQQELIKLQQQIYTINNIENNQKYNLELLLSLSKTMPALAHLDLIEKNNVAITIKGRSYTLAAIAEFMQKIDDKPLFEPPTLQEITNANNPALPEKNFCITIMHR